METIKTAKKQTNSSPAVRLETGWLRRQPNLDGSYNLYLSAFHEGDHKMEGQLGSGSKLITFHIRKKEGRTRDAYKVLIKVKGQQIKVGPVLGILTTRSPSGGFAGNRYNFQDITRSARKHGGLVYVFTPEAIGKAENTLKAYVYRPELGGWFKQKMPCPDVVYNRISKRRDEADPYVQSAISRMRSNPHIHLFNPGFLNKWELYRWLKTEEALQSYLPDTALYSPLALQRMLERHVNLFLKPTSGKAGIGVYKLEQGERGFRLIGQGRHQKHTYRFANIHSLLNHLSKRIRQQYIVQQSITLTTYRKRVFDLRILVQKDLYGKWRVSGIGARVSGPASITTHVPQGGSILKPREALQYAFPPEKVERILEKLKSLAILTAATVEKQFHLLGELSIDIGIDQDGNPWLFEANSKPMKFDEPYIRALSLKRLLQYSCYLSGFTDTKPLVQENHRFANR